MKHFQASKIPWFYDIPTAVHTNPKTSLSLLLTHIGIARNCTAPKRAKESVKLDALRAFTRASNRSIKSYFTKTRIGHNKNKLKNQDILAQELRLGIYYSSCFVEYPPNPIASYRKSHLYKFGDRHISRGARNKSHVFNELSV